MNSSGAEMRDGLSVSGNDPVQRQDGEFPSTQWSMVVHAGNGSDSQARAALESLCRLYWYPLYKFIRLQGKTHHEAEDFTQAFLARLLACDGVARADPERGRFRTFLLSSLRNFMVSEWQRGNAEKRGGGVAPIPLEFEVAGERFENEPVDPRLTPEQAFDRNYAQDMICNALESVQAEYRASGRGELFAALKPILWDRSDPDSFSRKAQSLDMNPHALSMALQRARRRFGERLRANVAQTVALESDVDAELRHLISSSGGESR
jgi:DNA-directed RNA polymerase specialized sigma24 family protein